MDSIGLGTEAPNGLVGHDQQLQRLRAWYGGPLLPGRRTPLSLLIIQPTRFCNIDCQYCYLPMRDDRRRMDPALLDIIADRVAEAGLADHELSIAWHAAEPLVLPASWYKDAVRRFSDRMGPSCRITHNFQTNAMLVNDGHIELFRQAGMRVGVSLDGPAFLHDLRRRTRRGDGTHAKAMEGVTRLREAGIPFSAICVLSRPSLDHPDEIYDFFRDLGVTALGFNVEEIEGENTASTLATEDAVAAYTAFFHRIFRRAREDRHALSIREVDQATRAVGTAVMAGASFRTEAEPFGIISVDVDGHVVTFSPELVDLTDARGLNFALGNVREHSFPSLAQSARLADLLAEIRKGEALCRASCAFYGACGGGTPANKLFENGSFASTETLHCRLTRQALLQVAEEETIHAIREVQARRTMRGPAPSSIGPDASTLLLTGIRVLDAPSMSEAVRLSNGTAAIEDAAPERAAGYQPGARVPLQAWRAALPAELDAMSRAPQAGSFGFVARIILPPSLQEAALRLGASMADTRSAVPIPPELVAALADRYAEAGVAVRPLGALAQPVGELTSTIDQQDGRRLGLHLDSFFRLPLERREDAPNRLCINIGTEPRRLLFVPVPVKRMLRDLVQRGAAGPDTHPTELGRIYLRLFPGTPVVGLTIRPGEGYIAPTELLLHDGQPMGQTEPDRTLTLLGRFRTPHAQLRQPGPSAGALLRPGVPLHGGPGLMARVTLSMGVRPAASLALQAAAYKPDAMVPRGPWRQPTPQEAIVLRSQQAAELGPRSVVCILRPPADIFTELMHAIEPLGRAVASGEEAMINAILDRAAPLHRAVAGELTRLYGERGAPAARSIGIGWHPPGCPTVTSDGADRLKFGLHLDGWSQLPIERHATEAPNRITVNLGTEPRHFLFVNQTVMTMGRALRAAGVAVPAGINPTDLAAAFLRHFPATPVIRLAVQPLEAYLAPTEEVAHDAATEGRGGIDLNLMVIGHFRPPPGDAAGLV